MQSTHSHFVKFLVQFYIFHVQITFFLFTYDVELYIKLVLGWILVKGDTSLQTWQQLFFFLLAASFY